MSSYVPPGRRVGDAAESERPRQRIGPCPRPRSNSASPTPPPPRSPNGCDRRRSTRSSASATCSAPASRLRVAFESGRLHSMILWGPPGVGKTTLARLMADAFDAQFIAMSAVLGGVKDIREAVERAQAARTSGRATVVFVDEVHRFNKSQQDAFLPHVESGLFTFIGATTENPSFEVISALLSRATVHVLKPLDDERPRDAAGSRAGAARRRRRSSSRRANA